MSKEESNEAQQEALLREYSALSGAVADATKRIETVRGLYIAAAFAIVGKLLGAQPGFVEAIIQHVRSDGYLVSGALLLPFLNSLLLIYSASAMHFILAAAQYNTFKIGPQLTRQTELPVLQFDHWSSDNKDFWVLLRTISGVLFYGFAMLGSIVVLVSLRTAGRFQVGFLPGLVFIGAIGVVSFSIIVGAISFRVSGTFGEPDKRVLRRKTLYWSTLILTVLHLRVAYSSKLSRK